MATQSAGIQQLLQAEKKAAEIVSEARKRRTKRLKQAKEEATIEIENFKNEKEKHHKFLESQILGSRSTNEDLIKQKTDEQIEQMILSFEKNSKNVMGFVIDAVKNVEPKAHENLR